MSIYLTLEQTLEAKALCQELPIILDRLQRAGLHRTAKAFQQGPLEMIGFELAEKAYWNSPESKESS